MKINKEIINGIVFLTLLGELDSRGNQLLDKELKDLAKEGNYNVILDLSSIRFLGSQTLSLLLSNLKELRAGGGNIKFLNPQRAVLQYLKTNRIIELFEIFSSRADAIHSYQSPKYTSKNNSVSFTPTIQEQPTLSDSLPAKSAEPASTDVKSQFETGKILYANSCMLATLIKVLENKKIISTQEAKELMDYESLSIKGVTE